MARETTDRTPRAPMPRWRRYALIGLVALLALSVAARALIGADEPSADPAGGGDAVVPHGLVEGGATPGAGSSAAAEPDGALEDLLPLLTEGTFFALIGFALGYASRKVVKLGLIFVAIFFAGLQALVYAGVADVDWSAGIELINGLILNVKQDQTFSEILKAKIPTAGGLFAGFLLGFRRG